jgi:hypothetical protein
MIVRRFVYDSRLGAVVELGQHNVKTTEPTAAYADAEGQWKQRPAEDTGLNIRNAALERAERRVFAHRKYGDEGRWTEK